MPRFELGVIVDTKRLRLRPFTEDDVDDVLRAVDDPEIRRWLPWSHGYDRARAVDFCTREAHDAPEARLRWAVDADDRLVGSASLHRADWGNGGVEIGYWIAPWSRRRGYAVEAVRAVAAYAYSLGLHRVELHAAVGNAASRGVAVRAGFTEEGVRREAGRVGDRYIDMVLYAQLSGDI
ncbi:MAG TPA: GNAT family protein [Streptosporangiaceae bacterium]|jgi:RimJ/RimL family protein N-acetyltransferase